MKTKKAGEAISGHFVAGLENCTRPLVFTSASGCRASEILIFLEKIIFFPCTPIFFCDTGQVPISRYFEACVGAILPSVNEEFQRMLLPFILYALFK